MRLNTYGSPKRRSFGFAESYFALAYQTSTLSTTLSRPRRSITRVLPPGLILFLSLYQALRLAADVIAARRAASA
jgi:hypothetical protein